MSATPSDIRRSIAAALTDTRPDMVGKVQAFALAVAGGMSPEQAAASVGLTIRSRDGLTDAPIAGNA